MKTFVNIAYYHSQLVGMLELRVSDKGLTSIRFVESPDHAVPDSTDPIMNQLISELDSYFRKELKEFSVPIDIDSGTAFQKRVWEALCEIPYGETRSYREVAESVGDPKGARAVGSANGRNPIPIVIPCHRVINADGKLGGYSSGLPIKEALLKLEGASPII